MPANYRAAWVPDNDPERPWDEAVAVAAGWLREQAAELHDRPLLVTYSFQNGDGLDTFRGFEHVTTRSKGSVTGPVGRPVLAYVPEERVMALAHRHARKAALCAVESVSFPLHGWARRVGAVNLLDGSVLPPLNPAASKLLDRVEFIGNNGWGDQYGKRDAMRLLPELAQYVDRAEVLGYVLAGGAHDGSVKNLAGIVKRPRFDAVSF
jgi:hypothetical protein